jgi:protein-L-isoaspartate(D-aspartate) O-methyltransferase
MDESMPESQDFARVKMVETQIKARGILDERVLKAFLKVPRHSFVPEHSHEAAYRDGPLPIGSGQTISQPYMVASMTVAARVAVGDRVLEIGTGSGYQTAILAELGAYVWTIERIHSLLERAQRTLASLDYTGIRFKLSDGTLGWPAEAPFDSIIVTAGAPEVPAPLIEELAEGGRLVVPVEEGFSQVLYTVRKQASGIDTKRGERCTFVPLIGKHGWPGS